MKNIYTLFFILLLTEFSYAQKDYSNGLLVFFDSNNIVKSKGKTTIKEQLFSNNKLLNELKKIDLDSSNFVVAVPNFKRSDTVFKQKDGTFLKQLDLSKLYRLRIDNKVKRQEILNKLNKIDGILFVEQNGSLAAPYLTPNDSLYINQWGLKNKIPEDIGKDIHAEAAWDIFTGNPNNIIGFLDFGIQPHIDIDAKILSSDIGVNASNNLHGLSVASIASAISNNGKGITGVDWEAKIIAKRVDIGDIVSDYQKIIEMVNFSPNVKVINHSWGTKDKDGKPGQYSQLLYQAFVYAYKANRTSVAAMGNFAVDYPLIKCYPAGFNHVIAVGAMNGNDTKWEHSSFGSHIDISAPGSNIVSLGYPNGESGTSFAAPFVTGVASLLHGYKPELTNDDVENIIKHSARKFPDLNGDFNPHFGFGMVNAESALKFLKEDKVHQFTAIGGTIENSTENYLTNLYTFANLPDGSYLVKRHTVSKTVTFPYSFCNPIAAWGRGVGSSGYNSSSPNFGEGFCEIVPGSLTNNSVTLRTYIYEVYNVLGQNLGYFPTTPANVTFAYTVLGQANNYDISLASQNCNTATYTIPNLPTGSSVNWSINGPFTITSTGSVDQITIQRSSNDFGLLTASISTVCGNFTVTKNINPIQIDFRLWSNNNGYCGIGDAIIDVPLGTTINWEVTGDLSINFAGQTLITTDNLVSISGTEGMIYATTNVCGLSLSLDYVHEPYKRNIIVDNNPIIGGMPLSASIENVDFPYTTIKWYVDGATIPFNNTEMLFDTTNPPCGLHTLSAEAVLSCGSTVFIGSVEIERYCSSWWRTMLVYPNPVTSYIIISPDNEKLKNLTALERQKIKEYEVIIYDKQGKQLLKGRSSNLVLKLVTEKLKSDLYYLHIKMDGENNVFKQQIVVRN